MLEQLILKNDAHAKVLSLKQTPEGLDFHFGQRSHAQRFSDFVGSCVPQSVKNSKSLISHDASSNSYQYKYTILCELCPVCSDDVVYVPKGHSSRLNGAAPLLLCHKACVLSEGLGSVVRVVWSSEIEIVQSGPGTARWQLRDTCPKLGWSHSGVRPYLVQQRFYFADEAVLPAYLRGSGF